MNEQDVELTKQITEQTAEQITEPLIETPVPSGEPETAPVPSGTEEDRPEASGAGDDPQETREDGAGPAESGLDLSDRLELALWRAGVRRPQELLERFDLAALRLTPDGRLEGLDEQLAAVCPRRDGAALAGSSGNFIRRTRREPPGLREAIDRHYSR